MEYLYEVSKNGLTFSKVKVLKECRKTYFIERVVDKRVYKIENNKEFVGHNTYCWYFKDETIAKKYFDRIRSKKQGEEYGHR